VTLVVDIRHWLTEDGEPVLALRRRVLRLARLIEYGGPLKVGQARETLVECTMRPGRKSCLGLLWVLKREDGRIDALCNVCKGDQVIISGWEATEWAKGPMDPISFDDLP